MNYDSKYMTSSYVGDHTLVFVSGDFASQRFSIMIF